MSARRTCHPFNRVDALGKGAGFVALAVLLQVTTSTCSVLLRDGYFRGACGDRHRECIEACQALKEPHACETRCNSIARHCTNRQAPSRFGIDLEAPQFSHTLVDHATVVDLSQGRIIAVGLDVTMRGRPEPSTGAYAFPPGSSVRLTLPLDAALDDAVIHIEHAASAVGCFVTVTANGFPLVDRYAPPVQTDQREMQRETFRVPPIAFAHAGAGSPLVIELANRADGARGANYLLARVALSYRVRISNRAVEKD